MTPTNEDRLIATVERLGTAIERATVAAERMIPVAQALMQLLAMHLESEVKDTEVRQTPPRRRRHFNEPNPEPTHGNHTSQTVRRGSRG